MKQKSHEPALYVFLRPWAGQLFKMLYRVRIEGAENIPSSGAVVIAGNHMSNLDCALVVCATRRCIHFLAKDELMKGALKYFFGNMGIIPVNRRTKDRYALPAASELLRLNKVIGIFPEGRLNRTDELVLPFKYGAVKMAKETGALLVPFAITGKYNLFRRSIKLTCGKPYRVTGENLTEENEKLTEIVSRMMLEERIKEKEG